MVAGACNDAREASADGPTIVLVDWTDLMPFTQLLFALPRDGRALPFMSVAVEKDGGLGSRVAAETEAVSRLSRWVPKGCEMIIVADRGYGNRCWMKAIAGYGWYFVERVGRNFNADTEGFIGNFEEMRFRRY